MTVHVLTCLAGSPSCWGAHGHLQHSPSECQRGSLHISCKLAVPLECSQLLLPSPVGAILPVSIAILPPLQDMVEEYYHIAHADLEAAERAGRFKDVDLETAEDQHLIEQKARPTLCKAGRHWLDAKHRQAGRPADGWQPLHMPRSQLEQHRLLRPANDAQWLSCRGAGRLAPVEVYIL